MSLRAGRVGVNPDQVDEQGRLKVSVGYATYAFIRAMIVGEGEITVTNGEKTLAFSGENVIVAPVPEAGEWTVNYGNASITLTITDYGTSLIADFDPVEIVQANVGEQSIVKTVNGNKVTFEYEGKTGISAIGFVYNTKGKNWTLAYTGGTQQHGQCTKTATLPSIINQGTGRVTFETVTPKTYTYNSSYYNFIGVQSGVS